MSNFEMINLSADQVIFKDEAGRWKLENAGVLYSTGKCVGLQENYLIA